MGSHVHHQEHAFEFAYFYGFAFHAFRLGRYSCLLGCSRQDGAYLPGFYCNVSPHGVLGAVSIRILVCSPHLFNLLLHSKMLMAVSALSTEYRVVLSMVITLSTEYSEYIEY
jgi:hypothetical protein